MKLTPIKINLQDYPLPIRKYLQDANIYDSSSSKQASVLFSDKGYFIKSSAKGALRREAEMTRYFHSKRIAPKVLEYIDSDKDWLVTQKIKGSDCIDGKYLSDPKRLCDTMAQLLRELHGRDFADCPIKDHTSNFLYTAEKNYLAGICDRDMLDDIGYKDPNDVWQEITVQSDILQNDTLLHGDYCLPNIILDNWKFSGFIDLDCSGVGDKHVDIFWGIYTLYYNLHTDKYTQRFIDAYGKDLIDSEKLRLISKIEIFG